MNYAAHCYWENTVHLVCRRYSVYLAVSLVLNLPLPGTSYTGCAPERLLALEALGCERVGTLVWGQGLLVLSW